MSDSAFDNTAFRNSIWSNSGPAPTTFTVRKTLSKRSSTIIDVFKGDSVPEPPPRPIWVGKVARDTEGMSVNDFLVLLVNVCESGHDPLRFDTQHPSQGPPFDRYLHIAKGGWAEMDKSKKIEQGSFKTKVNFVPRPDLKQDFIPASIQSGPSSAGSSAGTVPRSTGGSSGLSKTSTGPDTGESTIRTRRRSVSTADKAFKPYASHLVD